MLSRQRHGLLTIMIGSAGARLSPCCCRPPLLRRGNHWLQGCRAQETPTAPDWSCSHPAQVCSRLFLPSDREVASLAARQLRRLRDDGFVVVDGFLTAAEAAALRREALQLHSAGEIQALPQCG